MVFIDEEVCKKYRKIVFGRRIIGIGSFMNVLVYVLYKDIVIRIITMSVCVCWKKCSEWCIHCIRYLTDRVHDVSLKHCQIFCVFLTEWLNIFLLYGTHIRVSSIKFHWIFTFDEEYDGLKCTHGVLLHIRTFENTTYHFITFVSYNFTVYWLHIQLLHHIRNY